MAYERKTNNKIVGDSLDAFVAGMTDTFKTQMGIRNAKDESNFNKAVLEDNLSLSDQLQYRKDQLTRVKDDPTERTRIRGEISSLKDRIEQKTFQDAYTGKLMNFSAGISSIDDVISFLTQQKATVTDQTILDSINKELLNQTQNKYTMSSNLLKEQTTYAVQDKGSDIINTQIERVRSAKTKALLAGDTITSDSLDLQLQGLQKALIENTIASTAQGLAVGTITGSTNSTSLLDAYNGKIAGANATTPISIGGIQYPSERDFWNYKRDAYVADQGPSGLFDRMDKEITSQINSASSKGLLTPSLLQSYTGSLSSLASRPELAGYQSKIQTQTQSLMQTGANLIADTIINKYSVSYDLNTAITDLNTLKATGVNVDSAYSKLITSGATVRDQQVSAILNAAQIAMKNDPNLSADKAITLAISSGAGIVKSPEELATTPAGTVAKDLSKPGDKTTQTNNPELTAPAPAPATPATPPAGTNLVEFDPNSGRKLGKGESVVYQGKTFTEGQAMPTVVTPNPAPVATPPKTTTPTPTPTPPPTPTATPAIPNPTAPAPAPAAPTPTPPAPTVPVTYKIKSGDTLGNIARQNGTTVDALVKLNNIANPNLIQAGATLKIK